MSMYNYDRAAGCVIGYNNVIKAVRYIEQYEQIPPWASAQLRRVLRTIYGAAMYNYYRSRAPTLRVVASGGGG